MRFRGAGSSSSLKKRSVEGESSAPSFSRRSEKIGSGPSEEGAAADAFGPSRNVMGGALVMKSRDSGPVGGRFEFLRGGSLSFGGSLPFAGATFGLDPF